MHTYLIIYRFMELNHRWIHEHRHLTLLELLIPTSKLYRYCYITVRGRYKIQNIQWVSVCNTCSSKPLIGTIHFYEWAAVVSRGGHMKIFELHKGGATQKLRGKGGHACICTGLRGHSKENWEGSCKIFRDN